MIIDRIGRQEVLLPVNHKNYNFREKKNSQKFFFFGHRSLIRNNTQTAVTNMTKNRMLENKII